MSGDSSYSRDATVAAVRSFYEFLTTLPKLEASHIIHPPSGGWDDISSDTLAVLGKNGIVIDLLRHLPYIRADENQISYETKPIDYTGPGIKWNLDRNIIKGSITPCGAGEIPDYVAVLTEGSRYGSWLLLDTEAGTITDFIQQERPERSEPDRESQDYWRAYRTLPVEDFFEDWKEKYRRLDWVVIPGNVDDGVSLKMDVATKEVRDIYRAYGWSDDFDREACRAAVMEWDQKPESEKDRTVDQDALREYLARRERERDQ